MKDLEQIQKRRLSAALDQAETPQIITEGPKFNISDIHRLCRLTWGIAQKYHGPKSKEEIITELINNFK
jgi:hypothetical protein